MLDSSHSHTVKIGVARRNPESQNLNVAQKNCDHGKGEISMKRSRERLVRRTKKPSRLRTVDSDAGCTGQ